MKVEQFFEKLFSFSPHFSEAEKEDFRNYLDLTGMDIWFIEDEQTQSFYTFFKRNNFNNFLYDRATGAVIVQMRPSAHVFAMARLYAFYTYAVKDGKHLSDFIGKADELCDGEGGEPFIREQMGFFRSSVSKCIDMARRFTMNFKEEIFFSGFKFCRIDF